MKNKFNILVVCVISLFNFSCVDDLDFNQAEDFEITPTIAFSLVTTEITQDQLAYNGVEVGTISQITENTILDNSLMQNNLEQVVLQFELSNDFDRDFRVDFTFLDENENSTNTSFSLAIPANEQNFSEEVEFVIADNPLFLNTRKVEVAFTLLPSSNGSTIDENVPASLLFKSAGIFYLRVGSNN